MNRLLISGTSSGCGKTTITCALLSALKTRGIVPTAFKCGPDYIDPMFHRSVSGVDAYNLDSFFLDRSGLRSHLTAFTKQFAVIEGAMGYYDGIAATETASAYTVARETETPVILIVGARGAGHSLAAIIEGFARHRPDNYITGVIFNGAEESRSSDLERIAKDAGIRSYGVIPHREKWTLQSRRLGLLAPGEVQNLREKLLSLGRQAEESIDIDGLISLAKTASGFIGARIPRVRRMGRARIAIAKDEAFRFIYEENLELLRGLGCELIFFSPIRDRFLPPDISGLYLCGGYPELHAKALSDNGSMLKSIRRAIEGGLPAIAECGGFMYLHETVGEFPMCGVIPGAAFETDKLKRFGYITLTAERDNLLCRAGRSVRSHEFHYWDSTSPGDGFTARKAGREISYSCVHATDSMYAGFPHLYFPSNPEFAENFVEKAIAAGPVKLL